MRSKRKNGSVEEDCRPCTCCAETDSKENRSSHAKPVNSKKKFSTTKTSSKRKKNRLLGKSAKSKNAKLSEAELRELQSKIALMLRTEYGTCDCCKCREQNKDESEPSNVIFNCYLNYR